MFKKVVLPVLVAFLVGLGVALATAAILTPLKAAYLPGGSLSAGLMIGIFWGGRKSRLIMGLPTALAGLLGWLTFCLFV